ncbi:MAG: glycosyltransferase family 4 protein [Patescibacteria group bacterium]
MNNQSQMINNHHILPLTKGELEEVGSTETSPNPSFARRGIKPHAIIFSTAYLPLTGGAEIAMKEITDRLPDWQFDLFCARLKKLPRVEKIGNITIHRIGFGFSCDKFLLPFLAPLAALRIPATSYQLPNTIIWSLMSSYGGFAALVFTWLRQRTKMLLTLQEGDPLDHYDKRAGLFQGLHRRIFRRADEVQAISRFLADWSVRMGFKGEPQIIPNGVDVQKFSVLSSQFSEGRRQLRQHMGYSENDVVLVTTSRLSLKNGVDDLIRSLEFLPETFKALIVGEGEDEEKLLKLVQEKNLKNRVLFLGRKEHKDLPEILQSADIFVRPSLSEGLGNSFLEAMAAGLPIVGTPVGGIPDFLTDGETGVFCKVRDPESIAEAAKRIMEDPYFKEKLVKNGEILVRERYEWNSVTDKINQLLLSLSI